ncbi:MAG: glycosyltransferase family 9 protein [Chlamydiia bacterium]|nr:glycosyltransferase family 9 protein [Chlamydiia bacterium]
MAKDPLLPNSFNLIRALRQNAFDTILVFHTSQRPMLSLCCFAKPKHIVGTHGLNKGLDSLLTHAIDLRAEHEIERRLRITSHVGAQAKTEELDWFISPDEQLLANEFLAPFKKPIIGLHPGSKDGFKQWPPEHFIALGEQLADCGAQILVTGNNDEKALAEKIATAIPNAQSIAGVLPLRTFAAALAQFSLFITNDTGPMHISFAVKTKTVALFGPTDPNLCGPHQASNCLIFAKSRTCTPCLKKTCKDAFCMRQLGPQQIIADVKQFYTGEKSA